MQQRKGAPCPEPTRNRDVVVKPEPEDELMRVLAMATVLILSSTLAPSSPSSPETPRPPASRRPSPFNPSAVHNSPNNRANRIRSAVRMSGSAVTGGRGSAVIGMTAPWAAVTATIARLAETREWTATATGIGGTAIGIAAIIIATARTISTKIGADGALKFASNTRTATSTARTGDPGKPHGMIVQGPAFAWRAG